MRRNIGMSREHGATETFALLSAIVAGLLYINEPLPNLLFSIITTSIIGGLIGRAMWWLVVDSSERWSVSIRGAIAGGLTGWLSISPVAMVGFSAQRFSTVSDVAGVFSSLNAVLEFSMGFVLFLVVGTFFAGWITIPIAAITGYVLGREYDNEDVSGKQNP
jgi:hypothetical protein